jgi:hypothetical protein
MTADNTVTPANEMTTTKEDYATAIAVLVNALNECSSGLMPKVLADGLNGMKSYAFDHGSRLVYDAVKPFVDASRTAVLLAVFNAKTSMLNAIRKAQTRGDSLDDVIAAYATKADLNNFEWPIDVCDLPEVFDVLNKDHGVVPMCQTMVLKRGDRTWSMMNFSGFKDFHANKKFVLTDAGGKPKQMSVVREWLESPIRRDYTRIEYDPTMTCGDKVFNTYFGNAIEPDASGDCSLYKELVTDIMTTDAEEASHFLEWLVFLVGKRSERVFTAYAVRGGYGTGKTTVFELLSSILGQDFVTVDDEQRVFGKFNDVLHGKRLVVLEEAAFAGDAKTWESAKAKITGTTIEIEAKYKPSYTVNNYAAFALISNHDHFINMHDGDRRYNVLQTNDAAALRWRNEGKFEKLREQWNNGGAAKFLHEALNHDYRMLAEGSSTYRVQRIMTTHAAQDQINLSRDIVQRAILSLVKNGGASWRDIDGGNVTMDWRLAEPLKISSNDLEKFVNLAAKAIDPSKAKFTKDQFIYKAFKKLGIETEHGGREGQEKKTYRLLPPRSAVAAKLLADGVFDQDAHDAALEPAGDDLRALAMLKAEDRKAVFFHHCDETLRVVSIFQKMRQTDSELDIACLVQDRREAVEREIGELEVGVAGKLKEVTLAKRLGNAMTALNREVELNGMREKITALKEELFDMDAAHLVYQQDQFEKHGYDFEDRSDGGQLH